MTESLVKEKQLGYKYSKSVAVLCKKKTAFVLQVSEGG
jgi:hypothetical protein